MVGLTKEQKRKYLGKQSRGLPHWRCPFCRSGNVVMWREVKKRQIIRRYFECGDGAHQWAEIYKLDDVVGVR